MEIKCFFWSNSVIENGWRSYRGNTEAVTDSSIVREPNGVSLYQCSLNRFNWINGTCTNSLRYLPCFALLRMHLCGVRRQALQSALPPFPSPPLPLCALNQHKFGFIVFVCLFTLISFPFQRLPIRDLQTSEAEWQGSRGFTFVCVRAWVCVSVSGDWYKIKIQIERKHWNHHFCYRQLYGF